MCVFSFFQTGIRRTSSVCVDYRLVIDGKKIQSGVSWSTGAGIVVVMVHPTAYRRGCDDTSIPVDTSMMHLVTIPRYQCFNYVLELLKKYQYINEHVWATGMTVGYIINIPL